MGRKQTFGKYDFTVLLRVAGRIGAVMIGAHSISALDRKTSGETVLVTLNIRNIRAWAGAP
jgi:hypothetical protein